MDEIKKENYQLTIYKLSEFKALDELSRELELKLGKGKESKNNEVLDIKDNIKILYFSFIKDNTGNDITWFKKWNGFFGITNPLRASSTTGHGAIVIELTQLQQQDHAEKQHNMQLLLGQFLEHRNLQSCLLKHLRFQL